MNASKYIFPSINIKGCFFHFTQFIWRHIQSNGLQIRYTNDSNFALELRKLAALTYIPENNVISEFEFLLDSEFYRENEKTLSDLINYFEDT
jgi:hypothetical protein